jgi:hypothetical protein
MFDRVLGRYHTKDSVSSCRPRLRPQPVRQSPAQHRGAKVARMLVEVLKGRSRRLKAARTGLPGRLRLGEHLAGHTDL